MTTGSVTKGAKSFILGVATQTSHWDRPESAVSESMKSGFKQAVEKDKKELPEKAEKLVMRSVSLFRIQKLKN